MIEVNACLLRGVVYLAGETIKCMVTFTNIKPKNGDTVPDVEVLAWSSVQVLCQCSVSESRVNLPAMHMRQLHTEEVSSTGSETSFIPSKGERGMTVLSTKPKILFCDLKLGPGESKSYVYEDVLPTDAPPSFRGQAVKYSYKLTVGTQRFNHPTKLLRLPFRVLVLYGLNDMSVYNEAEEVTPSNPFLKKKENSVFDIALQVLSTFTGRKSLCTYNITNSRGKVAKFSLFKTAYKLGEDIVGSFDFSEGTVPCVQFSVTLQSEEQIAEECRRKASQGCALTSYVKHQEICLHIDKTHVSIPVPLTASPAFITDVVCLRWRLHFEFVTSTEALPKAEKPKGPEDASTWRGPASLNVETMVWDLPIKVFPTNPIHASSVTPLKAYLVMKM